MKMRTSRTERQRLAKAIYSIRDMLRDPLRRPPTQLDFNEYLCGWASAVLWLTDSWVWIKHDLLKHSYPRFAKKYPGVKNHVA